MVSRSCTNLLDLALGEGLGITDFPESQMALPRVMTVSGIMSDGSASSDGDTDKTSSKSSERIIIVANMLPLNAQKDVETGQWCFSLDEDSILLHLKDQFAPETEVIYVGSLKVNIEPNAQDEISKRLRREFNCAPTFLSQEAHNKFYHGFCKQQLWPLFHYMLPISPDHGDRFDLQLWRAYISANKTFTQKIAEVSNPEEDYVWIQDYHLMIVPTLLRRRYNRAKIGFFLHSPFPSSEIYRTLPVREEILKGLLNCDLIGFQTFDYARHFLSCCSRMLGLDYESKRGHIGLDYFGRTVFIKILPVGIHMGRLESVLNLRSTFEKVKEIRERFFGKKIIVGVDDMDIFKGISLKLLAFEHLLRMHPHTRGEIVLVQIVNPARSSGKDVQEAIRETYSAATKINEVYGYPGYEPVVLIDRHVDRYEKSAYYAMADCCVVNAVRDGMNLVPYKYVVCRQGSASLTKALGVDIDSPRTSMLVVSEFIGCSPSLSGAIRVNPWDIESVAEAMSMAINMSDSEKQLRHEKHYRYVSSHHVGYWACSFMQDLERACKDHYNKRCWAMGFGLTFRVFALSPNFRKISVDCISASYKRSNRRAIFLDYDGTVVSQHSMIKSPGSDVIALLNSLCGDPNNTVFVVSGRGRASLGEWLAPCESLGIAAEHGYYIRWNKNAKWESLTAYLDWKDMVEPVMQQYTDATDGSYIESKESAIVWHFKDADPDFGSWQSQELLEHLESVLANEPAAVKRGEHIVEVQSQGVTKGLVAHKVLNRMVNDGRPPDFVLCIGDDRSDEDMFESITSFGSSASPSSVPDIFACTVGQKPSKAKYFLNNTSDVLELLEALASLTSKPCNTIQSELQV
ncbi:hypothetical protein LIER_09066 [Lithospermum erythrorhizon]|uniref:alpha,alpha-trehalose-phosphate synthase (UDP-forming) n=1 Tax=Lithospermum erythrorhizon TaxID=34254 RepID=A0AAV3PEG4_LITER